jgi:hypothetical protein
MILYQASILPTPKKGSAYYLLVDGKAIAFPKWAAISLGWEVVEPIRREPLSYKEKNDRKAAKKLAAKQAEK